MRREKEEVTHTRFKTVNPSLTKREKGEGGLGEGEGRRRRPLAIEGVEFKEAKGLARASGSGGGEGERRLALVSVKEASLLEEARASARASRGLILIIFPLWFSEPLASE